MSSLNFPTLPIEILDLIIQEVPHGQLSSVLRTNSLFQALGVRALYHDIPKMPPPRCVACLTSLASNPSHAVLVHSLTINLSTNRVIGNFLRLLQSVLQQLKSLQHLTIELSPHDSQFPFAWLFSGTSFSLRTLITSARCDEPMARFLETQPLLEELSLNGFQTNSPFVISRSALPRLTSFRSIHAGLSILQQIVAGRPIEAASITIFPGDEFAPLDMLKLSSTIIQRLIILSLADMRPLELLYAIVERFPQLESLHFVMFGGRYDHVSTHHLLLAKDRKLRLHLYSKFFLTSRLRCLNSRSCETSRSCPVSEPRLATIMTLLRIGTARARLSGPSYYRRADYGFYKIRNGLSNL